MGFFDNLLRKHVSQRSEEYQKASAQIKQPQKTKSDEKKNSWWACQDPPSTG